MPKPKKDVEATLTSKEQKKVAKLSATITYHEARNEKDKVQSIKDQIAAIQEAANSRERAAMG